MPNAGYRKPGRLGLLLEDDPLLRDRLLALLRGMGIDVHIESNLDSADRWLARHQPEIILLNREIVGEPVLPYVRAWRAQDPFHWLSIIMLGDDYGSLPEAEALRSGCDSFVPRPFSPEVLGARVSALLDMRDLRKVAEQQRVELAAFRDSAEAEAELARFLLSRLSRSESLNETGVSYHWVPATTFSGDLIAVARSGAGDLYGMLADATGHGLSAAINLIPLTAAFHAMATKGFNLLTISQQLNQVVQEYSLADRFVAVTLARFIHRDALLEVVNAGNPAALLVSAQRGVVRAFASGSIPFGIVDRATFTPRVETVELTGDESLVLYSDGLIEACDDAGTAFGSSTLQACLIRAMAAQSPLVTTVQHALEQHCAGHPLVDDVSLLVMQAPLPEAASLEGTAPPAPHANPPPPTADSLDGAIVVSHVEFGFSFRELQSIDAVPIIVGKTRAIGVSRTVEARLFTILSELFANALEHGLLGLSSRLKSDPDGFDHYLALRTERLAALTEGAITVRIAHHPLPGAGGRVRVDVTDTGPGFDHQRVLQALASSVADLSTPLASGRGLALLYTLCDRVVYNASGNQVRAEFIYT